MTESEKLQERIALEAAERKARYEEFGKLYDRAHEAGMKSRSWYENANCVIVVTPGTSSFAKWAKKHKDWRKVSSAGVSPSELFCLSYAESFTNVLREANIDAKVEQ